ncbi:Hypothetical predicted protein [Olea europaea subsp. europaea]|uniref:Uncharacterized protein n=1 Tax=Olea europaea subsp. europaea TaxID=158383 RepID=A0A8S0TVY9_OLEEU|nr:Hypothetical predicted protein [Olea europaea subsp. europaea]
MLLDVLQTANFSSFLAGVLTKEDLHMILLARQIFDAVLLKFPRDFLNSIIKEEDRGQKVALRDFQICPCHAFDAGQSSKSLETWTCKLQKETIQILAKHIWTKYFSIESLNPDVHTCDAFL